MMPEPESNTPAPLKLSADPADTLKILSPLPAVLIIVPSLLMKVLPELTAMVEFDEKSTTPVLVLLIVAPNKREAFEENSIVPELFNVPVKSLLLNKLLNNNVDVLAIFTLPDIRPPLKLRSPAREVVPNPPNSPALNVTFVPAANEDISSASSPNNKLPPVMRKSFSLLVRLLSVTVPDEKIMLPANSGIMTLSPLPGVKPRSQLSALFQLLSPLEFVHVIVSAIALTVILTVAV